MGEGGPENCMQFYKRGGFSYIKEWVESLILDTPESFQQSTHYMTKVLELCGIILYKLGDLDQMPLANEILDILLAHEGHEDLHATKRELLVQFVMS
jgi:hypothetical protein